MNELKKNGTCQLTILVYLASGKAPMQVLLGFRYSWIQGCRVCHHSSFSLNCSWHLGKFLAYDRCSITID